MIPKMWRSDLFEWRAAATIGFRRLPSSRKPIQQPHPPIFVACSRPETVEAAGALGVGSLNFSAGSDDYLRNKIGTYREKIATARGPAGVVNNRFCCTPAAPASTTTGGHATTAFEARATFRSRWRPGFSHASGLPRPSTCRAIRSTPDELAKAMADRNAPGSTLASIVGDPRAAIETVNRFQAAGVDELILVMDLGTVPHEMVTESMRTFAERVMPQFT